MSKVASVILCGGFGSRLWPVSREYLPKPFLKLRDDKTFFEETLSRVLLLNNEKIIIVGNILHKYLIEDTINSKFPNSNIFCIFEPTQKNTASAIFVAIQYIKLNLNSKYINIFSADHYIFNNKTFLSTLKRAEELLPDKSILIYGSKPTRPETGYGYIQHKDYEVINFIEKPDFERANIFFRSNTHLWNTGIFSFSLDTILDAYSEFLEDIKNHIEKIFKGVSYSRTFIEFSNDDYEPLQDISFDYGILEKSKNLKVIKTDFEWMDIGSWESFDYLISADKNNNRLTTKNSLFYDTKNTSIHSKDRLIAAVGLEDIIIVDTNDATLVLNKNKSQEVKTIFQSLKKDHEIYSKFHTKVYRPWGYFDILKETEYFKIKQIFIKPNSAISYQYHEHRNEHWVVISGKATVTKDDSSFILLSQESTYIPKGVKHRLANDENQPLIIIEVQTGDYLGEDDIFRISDDYGR